MFNIRSLFINLAPVALTLVFVVQVILDVAPPGGI